jgi:hypothetical protein
MDGFKGQLRAHAERQAGAVDHELVAPLRSLDDGTAMLDESQRDKQPDWTFDEIDSGKAPVERLAVPGDEAEPLVAPLPPRSGRRGA